MRALLAYLWEHRAEPISEYAVGVEALGRRPKFDPKSDPTVRVQIARLRQKLRAYYESEDPGAPVCLSIPLGGHHVEMMRAGPGIGLPWSRQGVRSTGSISLPAALPRFWAAFLGDGKPTSLILPTPVFFIWEDLRLVVRDTSVNDFSQQKESEHLRTLTQRLGTPRLGQIYMVASDVVAAIRLSQYLDRLGEHISITGAPELSIDSAEEHNIIFLGIPGTSQHLQHLLERTNFQISLAEPGIVRNRAPEPGEESIYERRSLSSQRLICPGLIAVLPGKAHGTRVLLVAGRETTALISVLTSVTGLELFEKLWEARQSPTYFEALILAEVDGLTVLSATPMALRPFPAAGQPRA